MVKQYGTLANRPLVLVGKTVTVRARASNPAYFTALHERYAGATGIVHAVVAAGGERTDPMIKVKFGDADRVVFFRLSDLEVHGDEPPAAPEKHGTRASHLPPLR